MKEHSLILSVYGIISLVFHIKRQGKTSKILDVLKNLSYWNVKYRTRDTQTETERAVRVPYCYRKVVRYQPKN